MLASGQDSHEAMRPRIYGIVVQDPDGFTADSMTFRLQLNLVHRLQTSVPAYCWHALQQGSRGFCSLAL